MTRSFTRRAEARLEKRRASAKRLASRVMRPVSKSELGRDPLVQRRKSPSKRALEILTYLSVAIVFHVGPVALFWNFGQRDESPPVMLETKSKVVFRVADPAETVAEDNDTKVVSEDLSTDVPRPVATPEVEVKEPSKKAVRAQKKTDLPEEVLPSDWVDMASNESVEEQAQRRRVVGISYESTVGRSGPAFAVGNTRMGSTGSEAVDPNGVEKLDRTAKKAVSKLQASSPNRSAAFIPGQRVKFQKPKRLREVSLEYPSTLKAQGIEGNVVVMIRIGPNGKVEGVRVLKSSGYGDLDAAARSAAKKESFSPAKRNGEAVEYDLKYTYRFRIKTT